MIGLHRSSLKVYNGLYGKYEKGESLSQGAAGGLAIIIVAVIYALMVVAASTSSTPARFEPVWVTPSVG
jgi:hypothetical protein